MKSTNQTGTTPNSGVTVTEKETYILLEFVSEQAWRDYLAEFAGDEGVVNKGVQIRPDRTKTYKVLVRK